MLRSTVFSICVCLITGSSLADTIELRGGGHIAGKVLKKVEDGDRPYLVVRVDGDISMALPLSRVNRVTTSGELAEYRTKVVQAGDDAEKHYQLAIWCAENHLSRHTRYHMQRTIALDPDHSKARASLDYVKDGNEWILYAEQQRNRGLVSVNRRWQMPEVIAMERLQEEADRKSKQWIKEVARLRKAVLRGGPKVTENLEALKGINDPMAAMAIASELNDSRGTTAQSRQLRMEWLKLLGRFRNTTSVRALVQASIEEPDNVIREAALDQLKEYGASSAVATYLPMLNPSKYSNKTVRKALHALSYFPDRALVSNYVDALVTKHLKKTSAAPGISTGTSSIGGNGIAMGGKQKPEYAWVQNPGALTLLKMVEPGADFRFDQQAWREYFAAQITAYQGDLRRDP